MESIEILLAEDNLEQAELFSLILRDLKFPYVLKIVHNGEEASDYMFKRGQFSAVYTPNVVFLDLHMPGKSGTEVLKEIKNSDELREIPVIILTSSKSKQEARECYQNYANCFITKPVMVEEYHCLMKCVERFWIRNMDSFASSACK